MSEYDFVRCVPGAVIGEQDECGTPSSSNRAVWSTPSSIRTWEDLLENVRGMELDRTPKYRRPQFMEERMYRTEPDVRDLFKHDLGSVRLLSPGAVTTTISKLEHGVPDLVCMEKDGDAKDPTSILFPIEIKRPCLLRSADLVSDCIVQQTSGTVGGLLCAVKQAFGYMRRNDYLYGVLSTFNQTWFLKQGARNSNELFISPTVAIDRTEPTWLQCYLWLIRRADSDKHRMRPPSKKQMVAIREYEGQVVDPYKPKGSQGIRTKLSRLVHGSE